MSLTQSLNYALSGLAVNQAALAVTANNIANANTPGYSRQIVNQSTLVLDGQGAGAWIDSVSRKVDVYLERSIQREVNTVGALEEISDYYERVQILLGEPGADNSLDEYIQSYFNTLQSLAETPDSTSFKAAAVDTAEVLAREISSLAYALEDLRFQADQDIDEAVKAINVELAHLESVNRAIERAQALNSSTASLLDARDASIETLSEYIDISAYYNESGSVNIFTANGIGLVENNISNELSYVPMSGIDDFVEDSAVNAVYINILDDDGGVRLREELISGGIEDAVTSKLDGGRVEGLRQLRDELIPDILAQLDELAANLRDATNAIHNAGSAYPPASELTGTRLVQANEPYDWTGSAKIVLLNSDGSPVASPYDDESHTGIRPLDLDLDFLDGGDGAGVPSLQTIIDEINNHFNAPPVKGTLGNLNNIQLASNSEFLPSGSPSQFQFDLDLENIANFGSEVWVTDVSIVDNNGAAVASSATGEVTNTAPALNISSFDFTNGSSTIAVNTSDAHGLVVGDYVYIENPGGGPYSGINAGQMAGMFQITAINDNDTFEISVGSAATATAAGVAPANTIDALPKYHELEAGEKSRARDNGVFTADLSANTGADYYDITVTVYNRDLDGDSSAPLQSGTLTYRVYNNEKYLLNDRYDVKSVGGSAEREFPSTPHQYVTAMLVDENGDELPNTSGYYGTQSGYLKLVTNSVNSTDDYRIAIDEGTSVQQGQITNKSPSIDGTGRAFSHYFELNNFFASNDPTATGDATSGSAINMAVEERLLDDPSLISTGTIERSNQPVNPDDPALYTYERYIGNNSIAQRLAEVGFSQIEFSAAGGLPNSKQTFSGYVGELLGYVATKTVMAESAYRDADTLLQGLITRADSISGVNLDEELANTQLYQAAYNASARIIAVTDELFEALLSAFN